jgi:hypothetical protein
VQPVLNPVPDFCILENLLPFTEYELVVRTINNALDMTMVNRNTFKQSPIMHFSTAGKKRHQVQELPPPPFKKIIIVNV